MKTRCCCSKRYLLVFSILLVSVGSIFYVCLSFFLFLSFSEESIVIMR